MPRQCTEHLDRFDAHLSLFKVELISWQSVSEFEDVGYKGGTSTRARSQLLTRTFIHVCHTDCVHCGCKMEGRSETCCVHMKRLILSKYRPERIQPALSIKPAAAQSGTSGGHTNRQTLLPESDQCL